MIAGILNRAEMEIDAVTGAAALTAVVELIDDALGPVGVRREPVTDPTIVAQVVAFTDALLPALSAQMGFTVTRP